MTRLLVAISLIWPKLRYYGWDLLSTVFAEKFCAVADPRYTLVIAETVNI